MALFMVDSGCNLEERFLDFAVICSRDQNPFSLSCIETAEMDILYTVLLLSQVSRAKYCIMSL